MGIDYSKDFFIYLKIELDKKYRLEKEYRFHPKRKWRFDIAMPEKKIAIEIDGGHYKFGGGRHSTESDYEKINEAQILGWKVLRFNTKMSKDFYKCLELIKRCLEVD